MLENKSDVLRLVDNFLNIYLYFSSFTLLILKIGESIRDG